MFDQLTFPNGLRIIGERIPHFRSVSVGLWIGAGSQYETPDLGGVSHFLEHMVFKGTQKRTARQIAEEMDEVGGQLNAFTSKECTCFYAKVVDEHLALAMDVLSDLVTAPSFDPVEMEKEKGVVIEEIAMAEDTPEDLVHELLMLAQYGDQPISRPILGTEAVVGGFTREQVRGYWQRMYRPENAVLALAGNYEWENVLQLAEQYLGVWSGEGFERPAFKTVPTQPALLTREKDIEQVHICLGYPGLSIGSEENYAFSLFNSVFGGAMSSRLFQKIREESGKAYSVYSYPNSYTDCGMLSVYAATNPDSAGEVYAMVREEARRLAASGLTEDEFAKAREQLKAGYILGLESTSSRMNALGRRLLLMNAMRTETEVIDRINAISYGETNDLMRQVLSAPNSVALVGKGLDRLEIEL